MMIPSFMALRDVAVPLPKSTLGPCLQTRPTPSCPSLALSTFCHAPALLHCSRGWGEEWDVAGGAYRCVGLSQRCCEQSELYVWRGTLVHVAQHLLEDTPPTTHPTAEMKQGVRDSAQNPRTWFASACLGSSRRGFSAEKMASQFKSQG